MSEYSETRRRRYRVDLETPRFVLRPLVDTDIEWLTDLFLDPEVNRYLWECSKTREEARSSAETAIHLDHHMHHFGHWAIVDRAVGTIHGWTELSKLRPWSGPSDEIGLSYVLRRDSWGQGIATEAARRLLTHGFEVNELDLVMAVARVENRASQRVLEKLGMRRLHTYRAHDGNLLQYFRIDRPGHTPSR